VILGEWHTAVVWRSRKNASLSLDGSTPVLGFAEGIFQGLDLLGPFYVGGLPTFNGIGSGVGFKRGFVGCVSKVAIGHRLRWDIILKILELKIKLYCFCQGYNKDQREFCWNNWL